MKTKHFNLVALTLLGVTFFSACPKSTNNNKTNSNTATNVAIVKNTADIPTAGTPLALESDANLNLTNFAKLVPGIKYSDAVKILGSKGESIGENDIPGTKTVIYQWKNPSGAFIKVVFQNDKLIDKVQTGLSK